jgi:hypothetical protein
MITKKCIKEGKPFPVDVLCESRIKLKDLKIPAKLRNKRGCIKLTEEDMKDEHIQYILNR